MSFRHGKYIRNPPAFRSDDDLMPLQAADFVAWWTRKKFLDEGSALGFGPLVPWESQDAIHGHIYCEHTEETLRAALSEDFSKKIGFSVSLLMSPREGS